MHRILMTFRQIYGDKKSKLKYTNGKIYVYHSWVHMRQKYLSRRAAIKTTFNNHVKII